MKPGDYTNLARQNEKVDILTPAVSPKLVPTSAILVFIKREKILVVFLNNNNDLFLSETVERS